MDLCAASEQSWPLGFHSRARVTTKVIDGASVRPLWVGRMARGPGQVAWHPCKSDETRAQQPGQRV